MVRKTVLSALLVLVASVFGCAFQFQPMVSDEAIENRGPKIPATVVVKAPDSFWTLEYVATYEGKEVTYALGKSVRDALPRTLSQTFSSVVTATGPKDNPKCDWVASLKWGSPNSYTRTLAMGIELDVTVDFTSCSSGESFSIDAKGKGETGFLMEGTLRNAANEAMTQLMVNLQENIFQKKRLFTKR
jgi:hypothetical protein